MAKKIKTYSVEVVTTQRWAYVYEVEAGNKETAKILAMREYMKGEDATDSYVISDKLGTAKVIKEG